MVNKNSRFKKKGPFRVEALAPMSILSIGAAFYFTLLFDPHMKMLMEWGGSRLNGAEVNIGKFKTSFLSGSVSIHNIQVTDKDHPEKNLVQVGEVQLKLLLDALLRAKFVVELASVQDIKLNTQRTQPGKIWPVEKSESAVSGGFSDKVLVTKDKVLGNALADTGRILEGFDPSKQLKNIGELKSTAKLNQMKNSLVQKQSEWSGVLNTLPGDKDFSELQNRVASIQAGRSPAEIGGQVNQLNSTLSETQEKASRLKTQSESLVSEINGFGQSIQEVEKTIQQDKQEIASKLKLPQLDAKNLAQQLFVKIVSAKLGGLAKYFEMAKAYMPAPGSTSERSSENHDKPLRAKGRTYEFGKLNAYPLFWLKKVVVSSPQANFSGEGADFTSNPALLGKPAILKLSGDFPSEGYQQVVVEALFDHTKSVPFDRVKARVGAFPVRNLALSESDQLSFGLSEAAGSTTVEGSLKGEQLLVSIESSMIKTKYQIQSGSKILSETLKNITDDLPSFSVQARVSGTLQDPQLTIQSNLASALEKGFQKQIQNKIELAKKQIDDLVNAQVNGRKKELLDQYAVLKNQVFSQVEQRNKKAEEVKGLANAKIVALKDRSTSLQNEAARAAQGQAQGAAEGMKKKFGF